MDPPLLPAASRPRHLTMAGLVRAQLTGFGFAGERGLGKEPVYCG